jgi:hypothetical protein
MQVNQDPDDMSVFLGVMKGNERVRPCIYMFYLQTWGIFYGYCADANIKLAHLSQLWTFSANPIFFNRIDVSSLF